MATDSTLLSAGQTTADSDQGAAGSDMDFSGVQLAAATPAGVVPVQLPQGGQVVVVPVKPGQTIELPTDSANGLLAKIGADGNLAIVVDGRTIILQGYAAADAESAVTIVTNDGDIVDITEVILATLPDVALDIQTAAGPAAGPQGGTDGDGGNDPNTSGSGIFEPFAVGPLLGGFDAVGVLKATNLGYKLIDDERVIYDTEVGNDLPQGIEIIPDDGQPVAEDGAFLLDEDFLKDGNHDQPAPSAQDDDGSATASGTVVVDFGLDGPRPVDPILMNAIVGGNGTASNLFTTDGTPILLHLDAPAGGQQVLHGYLTNPGVDDAFVLILDTQTGHFEVFLNTSLQHTGNSFEDNVALAIDFTAFDFNGDEQSATLHLNFDDDMPEITVGDGQFALAVDETVSFSKSDFDDPNFPNGGIQDGSRLEGDEIFAAGLPAALTAPAYGPVIGAAEAQASVLFDVDFGADNDASKDSEVYSLTILDGATGLTDTQSQEPITLHNNGSVVEGRNTSGDVVFALTVDPVTGEVSMAQYRAIDHGDEEAAPGAHDEVVALGAGFLGVTLTATDGDGDQASKTVDIGGAISFDDDGPRWVFTLRNFPTLDEDALPGGVASGPGDGGSGTLSTGLIEFHFGSDLPGTLSIGALTVRDSAGNTIALGDLHTADGHDITIDKSVDAGTGVITWAGVVTDGPNAGDPVFTFTLDGSGANIGNYTFKLQGALEHPFTDADLLNNGPDTAYEDNLSFDFTVVATDGDGDEATANISIQVDDDSPTISHLDAAVTLALDETVADKGAGDINDPDFIFPLDGAREEDDEHLETLPQALLDIGTVIGAATDDASKLFSVSFGADGGATSDSVAFSLKILNVNTGLIDTESGDPIVLFDNNGVIEGRADDGDANTVDPVVFALTIDSDGNLSMAQYRAVDHGDEEGEGGAFDEVVYLGGEKLVVTLTVTDADGDSVTAERDIGNGISFDDDGPTAELALKQGAELVLDESVGTDAGDPNATDEAASTDANDIGYANILAGDLFTETAVFGSDKEGSPAKTFSLVVNGAVPVQSGLVDTESGQNVILVDIGGGVVEGRTQGSNLLVFKVSVSGTGDVEVNQYRAVEHDNDDDHDESSSPETIDPNTLLLKLTVEDGDGDTAEDTIDLGSIIKFEDDGPTTKLELKQGAALVLDESVGADAGDSNADDEADSVADLTDIAYAKILAGDLFTETTQFGSDKEGSPAKAFELVVNGAAPVQSGLVDTVSGQNVILVDNGGVVEGRTEGSNLLVFTVSVNGSGDVEVHQYRAVEHDNPLDHDESSSPETIDPNTLLLKLTVEDGDGDTAEDTIDLGSIIKLEDDGPTLGNPNFDDNEDGDSSNGIGLIDEDALPDGIGDAAAGDDKGGTFVDGTISVDFGSDKAGSLSVDSLQVTDSAGNVIALANLKTVDGQSITITPSAPDVNGVVTWSATVTSGPDAGDPVFTFKLDTEGADIGDFSFELFRALEHPFTDADLQNNGPDTAFEDNLLFDFTVKAKDGDEDSAETHIKINVDDDSPTVGHATSGTINLTVDETVGGSGDLDANGTNGTAQDGSRAENDEELETLPVALTGIGTVIGAATADASGLFTFDFGADGGAATGDEVYSLNIDDPNTGLVDTATGEDIVLVDLGNGVIVGRTDTTLAVVFALTIDADGNISMAQYRAINHGDDDPNSYPDEVIALGAEKLSVSLTVTDADGDEASATRDIGSFIKFEDDGPKADLIRLTVDGDGDGVLVHDETAGAQDGDDDVDDPDAGDTVQDEDDVATRPAEFDALETTNPTLVALGYASTTVDIDLSNNGDPDAAYGSDGPGTTDIKLTDGTGADFNGDLSNLTDTETGDPIYLFTENGLLIGRVGATALEAETGPIAFAVSIDSDSLDVAQYRALQHSNTSTDDESVTLGLIGTQIGAAVYATITVIDEDGDKVTKQVPFDGIEGNPAIVFQDDGPRAMSAEEDAIVEDEQFNAPTDEAAGVAGDPTPDLGSSVSGDVSDNGNWGVDGFGAITQVQIGLNAPIAVPDGGSVNVYWSQTGAYLGTNVAGSAAVLNISSTGAYTFTLLDNMLIQSGAGELIDLLGLVTFTGVDGDGDPETISLALKVKDDIPGVMSAEAAAIVEDEQLNPATDEAAGVAGDPNPDYTASVNGNVSDNGNWGADGFGRITQVQIGANTAVAVPDGGSVTVYWSQAGVYQGTDATGAAASLLINSTGAYTFTLLDNMLIASGAGELIDSLGTATFTGVDGDGDAATIAMELQVKDDIPGAMAAEAAAIVEDEQLNPATDEAAGVAGDPNPDYTASVNGNVSDNGNWGADGFGRITQVQIGANAAVAVPDGGSVTVYWSQAGVYQGTDATGAAASLLINSTGAYTFTLLDNMLIASGAGELIDSLGTATFTGIDGDGDAATVTMDLQVKDDIPGVMSAEAAAIVEEEQLNPATDEAAGVAGDPNPDYTASVVGNVSDNGNWGADGFGRITQVQIGANAAVAVPNPGSVTVYWSQAGVYQGTNATGAAASLLINSTGAYTFTLLDNMLIASGAGELIDSLGAATFTGVDGDGDSATISMALQVKDDIPAFISPDTLHLENKGVAGPGDAKTANLNFASGADGVSDVVFNVPGVTVGVVPPALGKLAEDSAGNDLKVGGQQLYLYYGGVDGTDTNILVAKTLAGTVGFTITLDPSIGTYIFDQEAAISNGTEVSATDLTGVGGGNPEFKLLINIGGTTQDVAMTTKVGASINSDNDDIGISQGQTFETGESIRFDLVNGLKVDGGTVEGYSYDGTHNLTNRWKQLIQITGNKTENADFLVSAIVADADNQFFGDNETRIDLSVANINIYDDKGALIDPLNWLTAGITVTDKGDSIQITGLLDDYSYEIVTAPADKFSAIQVEAITGTDNFSLGFFSYGENNAGTSIDLSYDVVGTDGDKDSVTGDIDISLYPDTSSSGVAPFTGTAGNDTFLGTQGVDNMTGAGGKDLLAGNAGIDTIDGGAGNDTIIGGSGNDILSGGADSDTFVYETLVDGKDSISDFDAANSAEKLDISQVLDHDGATWVDNGTVAAAVAGGFLTFTNSGGFVQVNVDIDGSAGPAFAPTAVAVLTSVTFVDAATAATALDDNIVVG